MKHSLIFLFVVFSLPALSQKPITVEDFTTKNTFAARFVSGINWMKDGKFYSAVADNKIVKYDITTGQAVETILDGSTLSPVIEIEEYSFSQDESKLLLSTELKSVYRRSYTAEYYVYDRNTKSLRKLSENGRQMYATFSPDGQHVAFVRSNNLFFVSLSDNKETAVTSDGKFNSIINGTTDWVYEEEFTFVVGFQWSADSKKLAYYRFDESAVKEYTVQKWHSGKLYPENYTFKYPKAGEANSSVSIWLYELGSGKKTKANIGSEEDIYVPRINWTADPNILSVRKMNRLQNQLEIFHVNAQDGSSNVIYTEKSDTYVDIDASDDLTYLSDGKRFILSSESSGFKHLYLYGMDGKLIRPITSGNFEVLQFFGVDEKSQQVFYTSSEVSPLEKHFYSISLDGKKKTRLSNAPGTHSPSVSGDYQFYINTFSSATQATTVSLHRVKGNALIKVLEQNENLAKRIEEYSVVSKEFFSFPGADGTSLNGYMLKPKDFDQTKQYPVLIYQYSGPGSQNASNNFGGSHFYFHQHLVQQGVIVAVIDTRGTGGRGAGFKKLTYKQLGKYELEDLLAGGKYLAGLSYIYDSRLGIWGWSYGGYMTSLAMTKGNGLFKLGIAVAPVTNWRFYDTVYTERYLQTPQLNADGYDQNSPLSFAKDLQGKFLLIHGTGDDNVHFQNSVAFQDALINAGKKFESFYYPDKTHSIAGGKTRYHLYSQMAEFVVKNL